ncbi:cadherin-like domain-containing protein [Stappia sp. F7233]|uniref:Cadherin-like domain-containing protein n=1 Tax=Stappia albiluteola TaxID=2758565 RepID=A0A839ABB1_9HYPH|nr:cadherin-like domain-containing protein [Stappia albiluteola]MBA5776304.1 cadherin-like domain-containing protein [Stappia albiluteola]
MAFETQTAAAAGVAEAAGGATYAGGDAKGGETLPPETGGATFVTNEDTPLIITDAQIRALVPGLEAGATVIDVTVNCGTIYNNGNGTWTFFPHKDFFGEGTVEFRILSGGETVTGSTSLNVLPVNDAPVLNVPGFIGDEAVNTFTSSHQQDSAVTTLADGGWIVTWASRGQDGSDFGIYAQRYDAAGKTVGGEFRVNTTTAGSQRLPEVAALKDGGYVVTWQSTGDGSQSGIFHQRFDAEDRPVGSQEVVNQLTIGAQEEAVVAGLADGGHVVVWCGPSNNRQGIDIYARTYDADGKPTQDEWRVNTHFDADQDRPSVTALADGGFVIVWTSSAQDGDGTGVFGQRYDASGRPAGEEFAVNSYTHGAQEQAVVSSLADGGFVVAWRSFGQDGHNFGVFLQRYDAAGGKVGGEQQANTHWSGNELDPAVTGLSDGGYVVTWRSLLQDGSGDGVYGQVFDADGTPVGAEFRVNDSTASNQFDPQVAALDDGGFVVTWTSLGQDGNGNGVYQRVFNADGSPRPDPLVFAENGDPVAIADNLQVADVDSQTLVGATVTIEGTVSVEDVLSFTARAGITGSYDAATGVLTLSGEASLADYQAVLRTVTYQNTGDNPTGNGAGTSRTITFQVDDGASENNISEAVSVTVEVVPENDAPEVSAPVDLVLSELSGLVIRTEDLLANASDPEGDALSVLNLSVDHGTLTDNGDGSWTYVPGEGFTNEAVLSYQVSDGELVAEASATIQRPASGGGEFPQPGGEDRFVFAADAGGDADGDAEGASGDDAFADGSAGSDFAEAVGLDAGDTLLVDDGVPSFGGEPSIFGQDDFRFV